MRPAGPDDVQPLVGLMAEFYAESGYTLDRRAASEAFAALLAEPRLGRIWLVDQDAASVGYVVLTLRFGMEYGGLMAAVDDFYVRPAARNRGAGSAALARVRECCAGLGVRAMTVEVGDENDAAQAVYRRAGFLMSDRRLMMLQLAAPTHEE